MEGVRTYADIPAYPTLWWFPGVLARGWITELVGPGSIGKGRIEVDLVARWTRGWPAPYDGPKLPVNAPGYAIVVFAEDDPNEDIRARLDAAGADVSRVVEFGWLDGTPFMLPDSVPKLHSLIDELRRKDRAEHEPDNPVIVICDPLMQICRGNISTNNGARATIGPLMNTTRQTGCVTVLVNHTVKTGKSQFGSAGVEQYLRSVFFISYDPADPAVRVIKLHKGNNNGDTPPMRFTLRDIPGGQPEVVWLTDEEQAARLTSWRDQAATPSPVEFMPHGAVQAISGQVSQLGIFPTRAAAMGACGFGLQWEQQGQPGTWIAMTGDRAYGVAPQELVEAGVSWRSS